MDKLTIALRNCHGIRALDASIDFQKGNAAAIYAPNGTMKTSFARTLADISRGVHTQDRMFPERVTTRTVADENGDDLGVDDVVVVLSYDEELGPTESTSTLLVNPRLRTEYEEIQREVMEVRDELIAALRETSGTRQDIARVVSRAFTQQDDEFFTALLRINYEIDAQDSAPFAEVPYDVLFNSKVEQILKLPAVKSALEQYINRLNELLDESSFFNRDSFSFYNASNVTKSLGDNGFFAAEHSLLLRGQESEPRRISNKEDLEALIAEEKKRITDDETLRRDLDAVERALNKNVDTRAFFNYLARHVELLPEFVNLPAFQQKLWKSYIKKNQSLYEHAVSCYKASQDRTRQIEQQASSERTRWEQVIRIFNERFFVPFRLIATNRDKVVLGQEDLLELEFQFEEGSEIAPVERQDLLQVLSNGEKKALYILNVLFEVEARRASGRPTLFVVDDIADSFDYRNKYAIIQYLKEMSEQPNFRLVVLTHNFDFLRTLQSRQVVGYDRCFMAQKTEDKITLDKAQGISNPFIKDFKKQFAKDGMKRVACIPFIRNILEYTKGSQDSDYLKLTSLLHWKADTDSILNSDLDDIFSRTFGGSSTWNSPATPVVDLVIEQANAALNASDGANFENKIAMSIAIRLLAERHMVREIADPEFVDGIHSNQTPKLFGEYRSRGLGGQAERETLDSVVLMTPENIHVNSFMYEPIIDMSDTHLRKLYNRVLNLAGARAH